jgi:hypothetical protein
MPGSRTLLRCAATPFLLYLCGCASVSTARRDFLRQSALERAQSHLEQRHAEEAAELFHAVVLADPRNREAQTALKGLVSYDPVLTRATPLGNNFSRRRPHNSVAARIWAYPLNRILDVLDIVSVFVGFEAGLYADVHLTRAFAAELGGAGGAQFGWWQKRQLGAAGGRAAGAGFGPAVAHREMFVQDGTAGRRRWEFHVVGTHEPTSFVYRNYRDYWAIGARAVGGVGGVGADVHPVEVLDALAGLFFVDFLHDDIGHGRSWRFTPQDVAAFESLCGLLTTPEFTGAAGAD